MWMNVGGAPATCINTAITKNSLYSVYKMLSSSQEYFVHRVSNITHEEGLDLAGWEDGLMGEDNDPYKRESFPNTDVYGYAWNNIWEWGGASRAYTLANHDYKVSRLYF